MLYYLRITFRSFLRHKSSTLINLIGLTTGLTCAFFIYLWVQDEYAIDKFHEQDDRLFQVMGVESYAHERSVSTYTPGILGEGLKADFPDIQYATTTTWIDPSMLSYDNTFLRQEGYHVGEDFFKVFSYPLIMGDPDEVFTASTSICISRDVAVKLFGSVEAAMGKTIRHNESQDFIVSGVFENISDKSTYVFDFVLPLQNFLDQAAWATEWTNTGLSTYVVLEENADPQAMSEKIAGYVQTKAETSKLGLFLKKYSDQYLHGRYTNGVADGGRIDYVRLFTVVAIFILLIACINFMNLSTARASKRALEVGVRKAIGAGRGGLIRHYLGEALLMSGIALFLSFVLAGLLIAPFNAITGKNIELAFTPELIGISLLTLLVTGLLAGSYPAFYLSHFSPIQVLKGEIKGSFGEIWARKGLVVFQFAIAIMLIIGVVVVHQQTKYIHTKHLGYDRENVIFFGQVGSISEQRDVFFNELRKIPGVVQVGSTSHGMMGRESSNPGLSWEGKDPDERVLFERMYVDPEFYETMGLQMAEGRWFSREYASDSSKLIINEAAVKAMGFTTEEALGQRIALWEGFEMEVIGVLKDFHYMSLHEAVEPAYFRLAGTWNVATRLAAGREAETLKAIEALYQEFAPGYIFEYQFLDKSYQALYESERRVASLSSYFASFAIILSCLGIFGLAAFTAERRIKEIGIRKVLGATSSNIVMMLSEDFIYLVGASILIALPLSYFFMQEWLAQFAYKIDLSVWIFLGASVVALMIAWLTVSSQALRAANVNPADCLKDE